MQRKTHRSKPTRSAQAILQQLAVVVHNPPRERFELYVAGDLIGVLSYRMDDGVGGQRVATVLHTVLYDEYAGHGLATRLTGGAMTYMRENRLSVRPVCEFTKRFLAANPGAATVAPA